MQTTTPTQNANQDDELIEDRVKVCVIELQEEREGEKDGGMEREKEGGREGREMEVSE